MFTHSAEFGGLLEQNEALHVSEAIHKAFIEVNEHGTEAAATTSKLNDAQISAINQMLLLPEKYLSSRIARHFYVFRADHGFVFTLRDSNNIYFMGRVNKF